jgi:uncharacterized protein YjaG (DUF416 family)
MPVFDMITKHKAAIVAALSTMDRRKCSAFMLSICERMYPNFNAFSNEVGFNGRHELRDSLDKLWFVFTDGANDIEHEAALNLVGNYMPDTENYDTILVSSALDFGTCLTELIMYLEDEVLARPADVAGIALESVDMYVQEMENISPRDPDRETKIENHPLMKREILNQLSSISELDGLLLSDKAAVMFFKNKWSNVSNGSLGF